MRLKVTPTSRETILEDNDLIISKTDTKGKITYVNRTFMRISQLNEYELLGIQHNVIRHPNMPRAAFKLLWDTLAAKEEYFAYIKNICKDGGFYWVLANITPDYDNEGNLMGYFSVRRKPSRESINALTPIYNELVAIEAQYSPKEALARSIEHLNQRLDKQGLSYNQFIFNLLKQDGYL